jgi:hypothetical protein
MGQYEQKLTPMVEEFNGFHDLEDGDGDEDEDDYRLAWDDSEDDDIDEIDR